MRIMFSVITTKEIRPLMAVVSILMVGFLWDASHASASTAPAIQPASFSCATVTEIPIAECEVLVDLYNNTSGPTWINGADWLVTNTPCSWHGIDCFGNHVTSIQLTSNGLVGAIPDSVTAGLPQLQHLIVHSNQLSQPLPRQWDLPVLQTLNLKGNQITGTIPISLSNLINLRSLSLSVNQLGGEIPAELGNLSSLRVLHLQSNQLTGTIPDTFGNLAALTELRLTANQLNGAIPDMLASGLPNLRLLMVDSNQLDQPLPQQWNLPALQTLTVRRNQIPGTIPRGLVDLTTLTTLNLGVNQLTGTIPPELATLPLLRDLALDSNQLTGSIPDALGNLSNLRVLSLAVNELTGTIPETLGNLSNLAHLNLRSNQLTGAIPDSLVMGKPQFTHLTLNDNLLDQLLPTQWDLPALQTLNLGNNQIPGTIPTNLRNLTNLRSLALSVNQLVGEIPSGLGDLIHLRILWLQSNQLSGAIPDIFNGFSNLQDVRLTSNQLTGAIPNSLTTGHPQLLHLMVDGNQLDQPLPLVWDLPVLRTLALSNNQITGTISISLGNLTMLDTLGLINNQLGGEIPTSLGALLNLKALRIDNNRLEGGISDWACDLTKLSFLSFSSNDTLMGPLPTCLQNLTQMTSFFFQNTDLCTPTDPAFQSWLAGIEDLRTNEQECRLPVIATDNATVTTDEGQIAAISGTVSDPNGDMVTLTPSVGSVVNNWDGTWSWNVTTSDGPAESQTATIFADDGNGGTSQTAFDLMVNNVPPMSDAGPNQTIFRNQIVTVSGIWTDPAGSLDAPYAWSWDLDGDALPDVSGSATFGTSIVQTTTFILDGMATLTFAVTDKDGATASDTMTVTVINRVPMANDQALTTDEDTTLAITLTATDVDNDTLIYTVLTGPTNGILTGTLPNLTYTPVANFNGSDSLTFKVNDGLADSNQAAITITVNPVNDAPVALDDTATTDEDLAVVIAIQDNDRAGPSNEDPALTTTAVSDPPQGIIPLSEW